MIHHITHNDLDGVACAIVARACLAKLTHKSWPEGSAPPSAEMLWRCVNGDYRVEFVSHSNGADGVDAAISRWTTTRDPATFVSALPKHMLLLTDIAPCSDNAYAILDQAFARVQSGADEIVFCYDHHKTNRDKLVARRWGESGTSCGAQGTLDFFQRVFGVDIELSLYELVRSVNAYDLWRLDDSRRERGETLHALFKFLGPELFLQYFENKHDADESDDQLKTLAVFLRRQQERVVAANAAKMETEMTTGVDTQDRTFGLCVSEAPEALTAHAVLARLTDNGSALSYLVMYDPKHARVGLYSSEGSADVGDIARGLGGGGHKHAAGFPLPAIPGLADIFNQLRQVAPCDSSARS